MKLQFPDYGILYIDDEQKSLKYFRAIFDQIAPIYTADTPAKGYQQFVEHHDRIGLVLCDKKMPGESGIDLLRRMEAYDPRPLRFLVTAYADLNLAVESMNDGLLYSYLSKPWDPADLEHRIVKALRHFCLAREREQLIREKSDTMQQLLMADKAASLGILSTGLNHHLRNALTVLRTFYDMLPYQLREELGKEPEDQSFWGEFYGEVGGQMDRMTSMLSSLAEGADGGMVEAREVINLRETVENSAEIVFAGAEGISFSLASESELPMIHGDAQRIRQMIRLLFQESRSNVGDEGGIEVRMVRRETNDGVVLTLIDDGKPMSDEELQHLFDPFFVRAEKPEDLGTNLLACYLTTFHHGGSVRAYRYEDGRNAIEISLPVEPPKESPLGRNEDLQSGFGVSNAVAKACDTVLPG